MTNQEIDALTGAFAYAITALDAQAGNTDVSLALVNKAHQCWDELLAEISRLQKREPRRKQICACRLSNGWGGICQLCYERIKREGSGGDAG